ncbi:unnamed protein product [Adineta ricciae]|uniref:NAD(P)(+)--arginine ADP-ribosyltransferase n=1 Tax=Adineta ricciae TaxID=249248 RepID=A0A814IY03_ADIRI|nr:unnamed protein product [Adineta ricciae]CAF1030517.1 unnamed protein product [Adineta ricciae]
MLSKSRSKFSIISLPPNDDDDDLTSQQASIINKQNNFTHGDTNDIFTKLQAEHSLHWKIDSFIAQNISVIWLNSNAEYSHSGLEINDTVERLRDIADSFHIFTDIDECVDFMTDIIDEEIFLIMSNHQVQQLLSLVENVPQLVAIYIFNHHQTQNDQQINNHSKVHGAYTDFFAMIDTLKQDACRRQVDSTPFSIVPTTSTPNLDQLDQTFMYTQLLKETILELEHDHNARQAFTDFCLQHLQEYNLRKQPLVQFQKFYDRHSPIWWYTKETFVYITLNNALRTQDTEMLIKMGFFLRDLHEEIKQNYQETSHLTKMIVYRGQGMKSADIDQIRHGKGGLLAFNCFLSTSKDREVSYTYADSARQNIEQHGILFRMQIDPSVSSTPYVSINGVSQFGLEDEILFSMHTVFRINEITEIDDRLWEVNLILTNDDDPELKRLTDYLRNEIGVVGGWNQMGMLMCRMGKFDKAIEIFTMSLDKKLNDDMDINRILQTCVNLQISEAHQSVGNYSKSLSYLEEELENYRNLLPPDHLLVAMINYFIGRIYCFMNKLREALLYFEKALPAFQKHLPLIHQPLATTYIYIGAVHHSTGDIEMALSYYKKALDLQTTYLPLNHPDLATVYISISMPYSSIGNHNVALSYATKGTEMLEKSLPSDHPHLAMGYFCLGSIYQSSGDYSTSLLHFEKALEIQNKSQPQTHPDICRTHICISMTKQLTGNIPLSFSHLEKALEMRSQFMSNEQPVLQATSHDTAKLKENNECFKSAVGRLKNIFENPREPLPPDQVTSTEYDQLNTDPKKTIDNWLAAFSDMERGLQLGKELPLPSFSPLLNSNVDQNSRYKMIDCLQSYCLNMKNTFKSYQRSSTTNESVLSCDNENDSETESSRDSLLISMSYLAETLELLLKCGPSNGSLVATDYIHLGVMFVDMEEYETALMYLDRALEVIRNSFTNSHLLLAKAHAWKAKALFGLEQFKEACEHAQRFISITHSLSDKEQKELMELKNELDPWQQMLSQ